ncbi:MAG TPA: cell wall-binding repeat-containing protein [Actinobacteria bacterium]|nr:cell wall-binding repeat-containing protein [Actinomycetota bacterium]
MGTTSKRGYIVLVVVATLVFGVLAPMAGAVPASTTRLAGADRYGTAVAISQDAFPSGASTVFVANGSGFPDALAGGVAAANANGPILLVQTDSIPSVTATELTRLSPTEITILGGTATVSTGVETALGGYAATVRRLWGADRFATAAAIAADTFPSGADTVVLAAGYNFPDALAGSPAATKLNAPLLLTRSAVLPPVTATAITDLGASRVVILGGTVAVSADVATAVGALAGVTSVERWAGLDRFATATTISKQEWSCGSVTVYVASGLNFPDALAGGPPAGIGRAPMLLVKTDSVPTATYDELRRLRAAEVFILGGTSAVSDTAKTAIDSILALPVYNVAPTVTITSPPNLSTYVTTWQGSAWGATVTFTATTEDANCDPVTVTWTSNVDGALGSGLTISPTLEIPFGLDSSQPTITATVTDTFGGSSTDSIQVKLLVPSP